MSKDDYNFTLRFLCISIEPSLVAYLLTTCETINLSLDSCINLDDAYKKIASFHYDVYLMDLSLSQQTVSKLINVIRETNNTCTIAIVSEESLNGKLNDFQAKENIDYTIQKPIFPQQIDHFFNYLRQRHSSSLSTSREDILLSLKQDYDKTIFTKIEVLANLIKELQTHPNLSKLKELQFEIHKMAGSAGSFGYEPVSILCKKTEQDIKHKIDLNTFKDHDWLLNFNDFLDKIKFCFQTESVKSPEAIFRITDNPRPKLYIVDDNKNFLDLLNRVKEQFPIELLCERDPKTAIERLKSENFNPDCIIVSENYSQSSFTGLEIISSYSEKQKTNRTFFTLLLDEDNIDVRLEAMEKGVHYIYLKPVSAHFLLKTMRDAIEIKVRSNIKVLVLDDDIDFCNFIITILSEIGVTVRAIHNPQDLFHILEDYKPEILLLDVTLPKYNGLSLLNAIRQDVRFNSLYIIIVTSSIEPHATLKAQASKADDILYKPIDKNILQNRIHTLAEVNIAHNRPYENYNYAGLFNRKILIEKLHLWLVSTSKHNAYLILFEIDGFADWIKRKGKSEGKKILVSIGNQLLWDYSKDCFSYNSSKFAILQDNVSLDEVEKKIYNFLSRFVQEESQTQLSFNCSITPISKEFENAQHLLKEAENGLEEANEMEFSQIKIVDWKAKAAIKYKKEVVIVDSDKEMLKILKQAFESHDILVKGFIDGESALVEINHYSDQRLPGLFIVERKLPDMDGLELYRKIKYHFHHDVPFFILTVFSSDKDVSEGIKEGVLEYIVKPFNISIFIQKALKVIYQY